MDRVFENMTVLLKNALDVTDHSTISRHKPRASRTHIESRLVVRLPRYSHDVGAYHVKDLLRRLEAQ